MKHQKKGRVVGSMLTTLATRAVTDMIEAKIKKEVKKSIKNSKMTPQKLGAMIGNKYLARKYKTDKRTRRQKINDRAGLAGKYFGKAGYKTEQALRNFLKRKGAI